MDDPKVYSLERRLTRQEFEAAIIAQDDDCDYSESGWVACVFSDGVASIGSYSHCSCYGTFDSLCGNDGYVEWDAARSASFVWSGSVSELVEMARLTADPVLTDRQASSDDYDYDHLIEMYRQVLEWNDRRVTQ